MHEQFPGFFHFPVQKIFHRRFLKTALEFPRQGRAAAARGMTKFRQRQIPQKIPVDILQRVTQIRRLGRYSRLRGQFHEQPVAFRIRLAEILRIHAPAQLEKFVKTPAHCGRIAQRYDIDLIQTESFQNGIQQGAADHGCELFGGTALAADLIVRLFPDQKNFSRSDGERLSVLRKSEFSALGKFNGKFTGIDPLGKGIEIPFISPRRTEIQGQHAVRRCAEPDVDTLPPILFSAAAFDDGFFTPILEYMFHPAAFSRTVIKSCNSLIK